MSSERQLRRQTNSHFKKVMKPRIERLAKSGVHPDRIVQVVFSELDRSEVGKAMEAHSSTDSSLVNDLRRQLLNGIDRTIKVAQPGR